MWPGPAKIFAMLGAEELAGLTATVPEAAQFVVAKARRRAMQRFGVALGFLFLVVVGSVWALANVQYFDGLKSGAAVDVNRKTHPATQGPEREELVAQRR